MTTLPLHNYLVVGAILFCLGLIGFLARRNMIVMFLSAEMMLQGVSVSLVAFTLTPTCCLPMLSARRRGEV